MRKFIFFFTYALIISVIVSCDEYLETESNSTFSETVSFSNLDFAQKVVNGVYDNLTNNNLYGGYSLGYYCDNDIEIILRADNGGIYDVAHYAGNDGISFLYTWWNLFYSSIERANICIDNLPISPVWTGEYTDEARYLYGEAVTLRAWCYYELINIFGDVPFKVKSTQAGDDFFITKTDRDSIYEYLIQDLKDVENYVPWMSETRTTERINKGFVKGLRAKMALSYAGYSLRNKTFETRRGRYWEDYYKIANQECKEVIESGEHQLNPDFANVFKIIHAYSMDLTYKEVLFEVAFGRLKSGALCYYNGMHFGNGASESSKYGRSASLVCTSPYYYYSFDKKDGRRNVSVELYQYGTTNYSDVQMLISSGGHMFKICKWRKSWINPTMGGDLKSSQNIGVNCPLMRYADIVLMYAETENEINNGPSQAAKDALASIRKRAFSGDLWPTKVVNYIDSVSTSKDAFFNAIVDERSWEFGGEMIRKNDLVRWNLLGAKISKMKEECQKIVNDDPEYANLVPNYIFWKTESDGETINILNPDYRLPSSAIPGYTRTSWLPLMSTTQKVYFNTNFGYIGHGYDASKNNHLQPISSTVISSYNGLLSNDQIP